MQRIQPCLWFDGQAEEAAQFYTSLFKSSKIGRTARYGEVASKASGQPLGSVMTVEFELEGQSFLGLNGGPDFKFTPAISFYVRCQSDEEIHQLWQQLAQGGQVLMELQAYPWSEKYGWCQDRFGVSWQLIRDAGTPKISPAFLFVNKLFGKGEEALRFYVSQFNNSEILSLQHDPETKTVLHATFRLEDTVFALMEGRGEHPHVLTPAISFMINCNDQQEVDRYWQGLSLGGAEEPCGWVRDKYGVSWQVVPSIWNELVAGPDPARSERVFKAMLTMKKLEIDKLKAAAEG